MYVSAAQCVGVERSVSKICAAHHAVVSRVRWKRNEKLATRRSKNTKLAAETME